MRCGHSPGEIVRGLTRRPQESKDFAISLWPPDANRNKEVPGELHELVRRDGDTIATAADVKAMIDQALGAAQLTNDWNEDGRINVVDVQIVLNAANGKECGT